MSLAKMEGNKSALFTVKNQVKLRKNAKSIIEK